MARVDIGFAEKCESWRLKSAQFPSKIGGKPAWLSYSNLPTAEELKCPSCGNPETFLCQIYAPYEECEYNFHRTLFIFACRNAACCKKNDASSFTVLRDNLPRNNAFYSSEPPPEDGPVPFNASKWTKLCALCGCAAQKICSKCKITPYCSREHQVLHWRDEHKRTCNASADEEVAECSTHLFPEYELITEAEELLDAHEEVDVEAQLSEYEALRSAGKAGTLADDVTESELDQHAAVDNDMTFTRFRKQVAHNPDQVLRYERAGKPLWIAKEPLPEEDKIPACPHCNSARRFEFQVMPQMLAVLNENAIDFGVLAVFTCSKSCWEIAGYKKEVVFKQDVTD